MDGDQHFRDIKHFKSNADKNQERDKYKMDIALRQGYSIIRLPAYDVHQRFPKIKERLINLIQNYNDLTSITVISSRKDLYQNYYLPSFSFQFIEV